MDSHAGHTLLSAFPELRARLRSGVTVLVGELPDQAALHGILSRIQALGLELLEVRLLAPWPATSTADVGRSTRNAP